MMHLVALLMPVLEAVDQYIDNLEQSPALEEEIARHSAREALVTGGS